MAWALSASGSTTSTPGSEQTLATDTTNATYYFEVDLSAMQVGDIVQLRLYVMTLAGGTLRVAWESTYGPALPVQLISPSVPQPSDQSCRVSIKQTAGSARVFPWKLVRV